MKTRNKLIILVFSVLAVLLIMFTSLLYYISTPTKGKMINAYQKPKKALLVIDTQEDFIGNHNKMNNQYKNVDETMERINLIQKRAQFSGIPVIYIRQEFSGIMGKTVSKLFMKGAAIKGNQGALMDKRLNIVNDIEFTKNRGDAFSNPDLDQWLTENEISELFLCGLDGEYCVHSTAKGALNRGYKVNIFVDGIMLGKPENFNQLIQKYYNEGISLYNSNMIKISSKN